jgi:Xaa-Pro aminopeptidase
MFTLPEPGTELIRSELIRTELMYFVRTALTAQMATCDALVLTALDSSASLIDVNVGLARGQLAAATAASNQLLFVRDPQDLVAIAAAQQHEALNRVQAYGRRVAGVASTMHTVLDEMGKDFAGTLPRTSIE